MVAVAEDGVPLVDLLHHLWVQTVLLQRGGRSTLERRTLMTSSRGGAHLDVLDELLRGRVDGRLAIDDGLDGAGPARRLGRQLAVETVRVFASVHDDIPVTCARESELGLAARPGGVGGARGDGTGAVGGARGDGTGAVGGARGDGTGGASPVSLKILSSGCTTEHRLLSTSVPSLSEFLSELL